MDLINRSLEIAPDAYNTIDSKAWIEYLLGQYDDAMKTMERFFSVINLPLDQLVPDATDTATTDADTTDTADEADFIDDDEEDIHPLIKTLRRFNINVEVITPVLTHLMAIYDALGMTDKATYIYDGIVDLAPDDEVIVEFKNKHKK